MFLVLPTDEWENKNGYRSMFSMSLLKKMYRKIQNKLAFLFSPN